MHLSTLLKTFTLVTTLTAALMATAPSAEAYRSGRNSTCLGQLDGIWYETNPTLTWTFRVSGPYLFIDRNDGFARGTLELQGSNFVGSIDWGNGDHWENIVLNVPDASLGCSVITTNQRWTYFR